MVNVVTNFFKDNPDKAICLLGYGGSIAYGTNLPTSDVDIRGIYTHSPIDILSHNVSEQWCDKNSDTTIYGIEKIFKLLSNCNPNVIELLGLKPEHYLYINKYGQEILDNKKIFLSKTAVHSFGGYAMAQLRRLDNKSMRELSQPEQEKHILNSIYNAKYSFEYPELENFDLYIDKSDKEDFESEIFMDMTMKHYPLRDWLGMWNSMKDIAKSYNSIGKRNSHALEHGKLAKHQMHLVRLFYMCFDILEKEEIITYREKEHELLMDIRNGKYLDENSQPTTEFREMLNELEKRLEYAKINTSLPEKVNQQKVRDLLYSINLDICSGR